MRHASHEAEKVNHGLMDSFTCNGNMIRMSQRIHHHLFTTVSQWASVWKSCIKRINKMQSKSSLKFCTSTMASLPLRRDLSARPSRSIRPQAAHCKCMKLMFFLAKQWRNGKKWNRIDVLYCIISCNSEYDLMSLPNLTAILGVCCKNPIQSKSRKQCASLYASSHQKESNTQSHHFRGTGNTLEECKPETEMILVTCLSDIKFTSFNRLSQGHDVKRWGSLVRLCLQSAISWWVISSDLRCASYTKAFTIFPCISMYIRSKSVLGFW